MRIVPVTRDHFDDWKRLRMDLYSDLEPQFHEDEMELIYASNEAQAFLALSEAGGAIGLLELSLRNFVDGCLGAPVGYIEGVYLVPEARGRGHGRALIDFAAAWFKDKGCRDMATDAELENVSAQQFYREVGFEETWRIVEFKRSLDETP